MSFWSDFTGKSAQKDLKRANAQASEHLAQGYTQQRSDYESALGDFTPYAQSGQQANAMYADAIGLNGVDARQQLVDQYAYADPFRQFNEDTANKAIARRWNAGGSYDSGAARLAAARANLERGSQDWNAMLDRWGGAAGQGMQAAGATAGIKTGMGDNAYNYRATQAGQAINQGNAMAASRSTLSNNLLGLAGTAVKAYGAF